MVLSSQWHRSCTHTALGALPAASVSLPCALCTLLSRALPPWQVCISVPGLLGFHLHVSPSAGLWFFQSWVDFCLVTNSTCITLTALKKNTFHNCFFLFVWKLKIQILSLILNQSLGWKLCLQGNGSSCLYAAPSPRLSEAVHCGLSTLTLGDI